MVHRRLDDLECVLMADTALAAYRRSETPEAAIEAIVAILEADLRVMVRDISKHSSPAWAAAARLGYERAIRTVEGIE